MTVQFSAAIDRDALDQALRKHGEDFFQHISEHCPHLFASAVVYVTAAQVSQMNAVIQAVERVVKLPGWLMDSSLPESLAQTEEGTTAPQHGCLGVFFGYDFHLNDTGAHLIEINTNAGGAYLNALLLDSQRDTALPGMTAAEANLEQVFVAMFRSEWRRVRGVAPLTNIAIVDEHPKTQYLYPEFLLAKKIFEDAGIAAHIVDPVALKVMNDGLHLDGPAGEYKIDLIYNRLTDFYLQSYPALLAAYQSGQVVLTPHPHAYARYADKYNLARLTDKSEIGRAHV